MRTTAALSPGPGCDFELAEVHLDDPRDDEVVVRISASGLCHTDLGMRDTMPAHLFPRVFGHEGAGVVDRVGARVQGVREGDHVVLSYRTCRQCTNCRTLGVSYCQAMDALNYHGVRSDGSTTHRGQTGRVYGSFFGQSSFAQHAIAYADNAVVVDPSLDLTRIGPYGCGFQTGAGTVLNVLQPGVDDPFVVFGVGAVGLAAVAAAAGAGVHTMVAVDLSPTRLAVAESYGARTVNPADLGDTTLVKRIRELTDGGAALAVDTTGVPAVIAEAVRALRPRGELAVLGLGQREVTIDVVDVMLKGKVLRGSVEGDSDPQSMVPRLLALAADGRFDVDRLVTPYHFSDINRAVADTLAGTTVKPVLTW